MTNTHVDYSLSRFELIVLARLSCAKPPSANDLAEAITELARPEERQEPAREVAADTLAALRRRALVSDRRNTLTANGEKALRTTFALQDTPSWTEVRTAHLPARALGLIPGSDAARATLKDASTIAFAVLRAHFKLPPETRPSAVCDAMIAKELGLPPGPVTLASIRAHVLRRYAGNDAKGTPEQIAVQIAGTTLGELPVTTPRKPSGKSTGKPPRTTPDKPTWDRRSLGRALGRRWLYEVMPAPEPRATAPTPHATLTLVSLPSRSVAATQAPAPMPAMQQMAAPMPVPAKPSTQQIATLSADALLTLVREAIPRIGSDGRFGAEKVFVSALWHRIEHDGRLPDLSFDRFKRWLVTANRDQLLDLARADLVGAMDPKLVAESEIEHLGTTFHFVVDRRAATPGSGRGIHAR